MSLFITLELKRFRVLRHVACPSVSGDGDESMCCSLDIFRDTFIFFMVQGLRLLNNIPDALLYNVLSAFYLSFDGVKYLKCSIIFSLCGLLSTGISLDASVVYLLSNQFEAYYSYSHVYYTV